MKKIMITFFLIFMVIAFDNEIFHDTFYNIYYKVNNLYDKKIVSNVNELNKNEYYVKSLSSIINDYNEYTVYGKEDLIDIYYTAINNGYDGLTFYCDSSYEECAKDINSLDSENEDFSYINDLVNVYNSYSSIKSTYSSNLRVDIAIERKYSKDEIDKLNNEVIRIINELNINDYSNVNDKIKIFHDYLANINTYDEERANNNKSDYNSDTAIGALFEGKAVCSGYTDAMAIFLDKLNLTNTRVATESHVWNAVLIDNEWKHIDLTWDDPVVSDGSNIIQYNYFLISTEELLNKKDTDHNFDITIYNFIN